MMRCSACGPGVWLASYPKSGNTWFRILLKNLKSGGTQAVDINGDIGSGGRFLSRPRFDSITMIESGLLTADEVDTLRPAVCRALAAEEPPDSWVKVHHAWRRTATGQPLFGRNVGRAAIYLVRDPRDVAVSLAHHNAAPVDSAIDFMNSPDAELSRSDDRQERELPMRVGDWSGHVTGWLDQTDVPVHLVSYEALRMETAAVFADALRFAGEEVVRQDVERAVRCSDFRELSRQEKSAGFRERMSATAPFFRRGEVGNWREELTAAQAARIVDAHGPVMERLGYLP